MTGEPPRIPAAARARIEQARVQLERALGEAEAEPALFSNSADFFFVSLHPGRTRIVPLVVNFIAAVTNVLSDDARQNAWTADDLRAAVESESNRATAGVHSAFELSRPGTTLEEFRRDVARATREATWWRTYQDTLEALSGGPPPFRVQLRAAMDRAGLTVEQLAERLKRDDTTAIKRNLAGTRPHPKNIRQYEEALNTEFVLPPKIRKRP